MVPKVHLTGAAVHSTFKLCSENISHIIASLVDGSVIVVHVIGHPDLQISTLRCLSVGAHERSGIPAKS
jgi:hypothetical protein